MTISTFYKDGVHSVFSNFYMLAPFVAPAYDATFDELLHWKSTEHYYQAAKAARWQDVLVICDLESPGAAKRQGRRVQLRKDWEEIKIPVMRKALELKFSPGSDAAIKLMASAGQELIEGNTWGDRFWGVDGGIGQNWLGHLLMAQRDYLFCVTEPQGTLL